MKMNLKLEEKLLKIKVWESMKNIVENYSHTPPPNYIVNFGTKSDKN